MKGIYESLSYEKKYGKRGVKRFMLAGMLGMALYTAGCGNEKKVNAAEVFTLDDIRGITMDISSWDIKIKASHDKKIHVDYEGKVKDSGGVQVKQRDGNLVIQQKAEVKGMAEQFSFGKDGGIVLSVPEKGRLSLDINNGSGELDLETVSFSDLSVTNDSGYISMSGLTVENAGLESVSGDITMTGGSCTNADICTESAYVTLKNADMGKTVISTDSGEVGMNRVNAYESLSIKTGSGDISLTHEAAPDNLSYDIASNSDDVTVKLPDTEPVVDTPGCRRGKVGKGEHTLSIVSDQGTVVVK